VSENQREFPVVHGTAHPQPIIDRGLKLALDGIPSVDSTDNGGGEEFEIDGGEALRLSDKLLDGQ